MIRALVSSLKELCEIGWGSRAREGEEDVVDFGDVRGEINREVDGVREDETGKSTSEAWDNSDENLSMEGGTEAGELAKDRRGKSRCVGSQGEAFKSFRGSS